MRGHTPRSCGEGKLKFALNLVTTQVQQAEKDKATLAKRLKAELALEHELEAKLEEKNSKLW